MSRAPPHGANHAPPGAYAQANQSREFSPSYTNSVQPPYFPQPHAQSNDTYQYHPQIHNGHVDSHISRGQPHPQAAHTHQPGAQHNSQGSTHPPYEGHTQTLAPRPTGVVGANNNQFQTGPHYSASAALNTGMSHHQHSDTSQYRGGHYSSQPQTAESASSSQGASHHYQSSSRSFSHSQGVNNGGQTTTESFSHSHGAVNHPHAAPTSYSRSPNANPSASTTSSQSPMNGTSLPFQQNSSTHRPRNRLFVSSRNPPQGGTSAAPASGGSLADKFPLPKSLSSNVSRAAADAKSGPKNELSRSYQEFRKRKNARGPLPAGIGAPVSATTADGKTTNTTDSGAEKDEPPAKKQRVLAIKPINWVKGGVYDPNSEAEAPSAESLLRIGSLDAEEAFYNALKAPPTAEIAEALRVALLAFAKKTRHMPTLEKTTCRFCRRANPVSADHLESCVSTDSHLRRQERTASGYAKRGVRRGTAGDTGSRIERGKGFDMLTKLGWDRELGLGKDSEGRREPLIASLKIDQKGLATDDDFRERWARAQNSQYEEPRGEIYTAGILQFEARRLSHLLELRKQASPSNRIKTVHSEEIDKSLWLRIETNAAECSQALSSIRGVLPVRADRLVVCEHNRTHQMSGKVIERHEYSCADNPFSRNSPTGLTTDVLRAQVVKIRALLYDIKNGELAESEDHKNILNIAKEVSKCINQVFADVSFLIDDAA